ncbi:MAG TPA: hydroxymethylbilane synthase [Acidimicrobiales bacterium]|nr:hydroxymethylbilane synthase [Acidimicrobiales bacterium]
MTPNSRASRRALRVATRGSPLALWQARRVVALVAAVPGAPRCEPLVVRTTGDALADVPVAQLGGQGAFVKEVQAAVLDGRADLAVHSAKDLPSATPLGLVLACVPERADPRDALVGSPLQDLKTGATVATGSVRRRAQLAWLRPDLTFCDLRGNMATRLERARQVDAGVLALAALQRLGLASHVAEVLDPGTLLPQVGQGALAVECREDDHHVLELLRAVDDPALHDDVDAERAFLAAVGGGCTLPLGALAVHSGVGAEMVVEGMLASRGGGVMVRRRLSGQSPQKLGRQLALELLDDCGGSSLEDWSQRTEGGVGAEGR